MSHGGGIRKVPKKCHVLYEWPKVMKKEQRKKNTLNPCFFNVGVNNQQPIEHGAYWAHKTN